MLKRCTRLTDSFLSKFQLSTPGNLAPSNVVPMPSFWKGLRYEPLVSTVKFLLHRLLKRGITLKGVKKKKTKLNGYLI